MPFHCTTKEESDELQAVKRLCPKQERPILVYAIAARQVLETDIHETSNPVLWQRERNASPLFKLIGCMVPIHTT